MSSYPPYAGPAGAAVTAVGSRPEARRPYVPAPWRSTPVTRAGVATAGPADDAVLPSIEAFLERGNVDHAVVGSFAAPDERANEEVAGAGLVLLDSEDAGADDETALRGEDWAMNDAAADVVSLAAGLGVADETRPAMPLLPPLPMWSDDDMLDIMPVARPTDDAAAARLFGADPAEAAVTESTDAGQGSQDAAIDPSGGILGAYQHERPDADVPQGSEAAAAVLETLARRIRDGELPIPGYAPGMGDAAALAAALASLLGLRR